jgi:hypothetical protein
MENGKWKMENGKWGQDAGCRSQDAGWSAATISCLAIWICEPHLFALRRGWLVVHGSAVSILYPETCTLHLAFPHQQSTSQTVRATPMSAA